MDLIENNTEIIINNRHPWELARYKIIKDNIINLKREIKNPTNIVLVDIGCGDSFVIGNLSKEIFFNDYIAIDINFSNDYIKELTRTYSKVNFYKELNDIILKKDNVYIFLLNDVIEHIENHELFLDNLKRNILEKVKNYYLYVTVPAYQSLFSQHDIDLGHYRRYKTIDLVNYNKQILKSKIISLGYFFTSLFIIRYIQKYIEKKKKNKIGVSAWNRGTFLTNFFTSFLILDYKISKFFNKLGFNISGLSCFAIYTNDK